MMDYLIIERRWHRYPWRSHYSLNSSGFWTRTITI